MEARKPVSGYSGFIPGITADNIFSVDYQRSLREADQLADQAKEQLNQNAGNPGFQSKPATDAATRHCSTAQV